MLKRDILKQLDLGNSVAELDQGLSNYFLITDTFDRLIRPNMDLITGEKGTGKTAIYQYLQQCKSSRPELNKVQVIAGINPSGEPIFRRFGDEQKLTEGQYVTIWKLYLLSLISNWVIRNHPKPASKNFQELESLISRLGLLSVDSSAGGVFTRLLGWMRNNASPKSVGVEFSFNEHGFPVIQPKIELGQAEPRSNESSDEIIVSHREAYRLLDSVLAERDITVWVVMDRLDESFVGRPDIEIPALRALVRAFMDVIEFPHICIKLFVRTYLLKKITQDGFVNLTHVNARKVDIEWDDDDLFDLLAQRIRNNHDVLRTIGMGRSNNYQLVRMLFPEVMDSARRQRTWKWILSQIREGNGVKAPRNLIDLCILAQQEQLHKERRSSSEYDAGYPLIDLVSLKKAANKLSGLRLTDTLMAEYTNDIKVLIKSFTNGKSEHSDESIAAMLGIDVGMARLNAQALVDIGFFERVGETYKIPFLYRAGLNITQGKAFNGNSVNSAHNHR